MNCQQARDVIHPYTDGELDLVTTLDIERHIRDCIECARVHRNLLALRSTIRDSSLYYRAPAGLERAIRLQIRQAAPEQSQGARIRLEGRSLFAGRWLAVAAAVAIIATALWAALRGEGGRSDDLASEITASHIRSLMTPEHLWDIKSTNEHNVKPWFDGKIDFAPNVRNFEADSYALEGGRLDYLAGRAVAALIYRHQKHYINLFIWPAAGKADEGATVTNRQGYVLIHWVQSGMNYWAASDMSEEGLRQFTSLVRNPGSPTTK